MNEYTYKHYLLIVKILLFIVKILIYFVVPLLAINMETQKYPDTHFKPSNTVLEHVAHDFKGMIQQISGLNAIMHNKIGHLVTDEINLLFGYIDQVCAQGNAITNDLLEACELEVEDKMATEIHSLNRIIAEQAKMYSLHATEKKVHFLSKLPRKQFFYELNRTKFIRALDNLFFNALRFTPANGNIHIVLTEQNGKARIEVRDSGTGIPEELQKEIFKKYSGTGSFADQAGKNTGLRLYIVKKIIELHQGNIWYTTGNNGTSFFIELKSGIVL